MGDEESAMDTRDVDTSVNEDSSAESDDGDYLVNSKPNCDNDCEDDLLNQCGPAIEFYESQSEDNYENNSVDSDDETSPTLSELEGGEGEYQE